VNLPLHPETRVHYAQIIPAGWGAHTDIHAIYTHFASRCPWISVWAPSSIPPEVWASNRVVAFLWARTAVPERRVARTALIYSEAIGDPELMLPAHVKEFRDTRGECKRGMYDAICGHTPWMAKKLHELTGLRSFVLPVGWDEATLGVPHFDAPKDRDLVWYGSTAGKRILLMPYLKQRLGNLLQDASGSFGRILLATLDRSRASLYVAHSDVDSFSTWRIWQSLATSSALIMEPGDCWPLDPKRHAVQIPRITWTNVEAVADELSRIIHGGVDLLAVARRAHEEVAREYTCENVINEYMVPIGEQLKGTRCTPRA
jgi:hypothetical protein